MAVIENSSVKMAITEISRAIGKYPAFKIRCLDMSVK